MKSQVFAITLLLLLSSACEDVGSRSGRPPVTKPPITPESNTAAVLPSGMIRTLGTTPMTYGQEIASGHASRNNFRLVPEMQFDDEGKQGKTANFKTNMGRPTNECGLAAKQSLAARVSNCRKLNGVQATWDGVVNASSTEGVWDLVALKVTGTSSKEIWVDRKTGMLWSDVYDATNWCEAAGNEQPSVEDFIKIDCSDLMKKSVCWDNAIFNITEITWRLPTRNDYLQADLDGLRFVLKKGDGGGFWTATMSSSANLHDQAWVYNQDFAGTLGTEVLSTKRQVRCIGISTL